MTHADAVPRFARFLEQSLPESLQSATLLYGTRTQALFEAVIANLGAVQLVKSEDSGDIYNADENLEIPDTRVVLTDGSNLLVETKNHHASWNTRMLELTEETSKFFPVATVVSRDEYEAAYAPEEAIARTEQKSEPQP